MYVAYCPLATLDVSNNTALEQLYCTNIQIITLDLSNNTDLIRLDCSDNQLSTAALNDLFRTLPNISKRYNGAGMIIIDGNPGENECDRSIAEEKGWWHWYWIRIPQKNMEDPVYLYLDFFKSNIIKNN